MISVKKYLFYENDEDGSKSYIRTVVKIFGITIYTSKKQNFLEDKK